MSTTETMNTKNLSPKEAKVMGYINVHGYDNINELTLSSGMPRGQVEAQVRSLMKRGLVQASGPSWTDTGMPLGITTNRPSQEIREVFHAMNRLYDILQREAGVNSDFGVSGAMHALARIAERRQKRHEVNLAKGWKPPIDVNKMIEVAEVDIARSGQVMKILRADLNSDKSRDTVSSLKPRALKASGFEETFIAIESLDGMLRRNPAVNSDYGFSGALYDLVEIVERRQFRLPTFEEKYQGAYPKMLFVSEVNENRNMQQLYNLANHDAHAEYAMNGGTLTFQPWLFGGTPFGPKS